MLPTRTLSDPDVKDDSIKLGGQSSSTTTPMIFNQEKMMEGGLKPSLTTPMIFNEEKMMGGGEWEDVKDLPLMSAAEQGMGFPPPLGNRELRTVERQEMLNSFHNTLNSIMPPINTYSIKKPIQNLGNRKTYRVVSVMPRTAVPRYPDVPLVPLPAPAEPAPSLQFVKTEDGGLQPVFGDEHDSVGASTSSHNFGFSGEPFAAHMEGVGERQRVRTERQREQDKERKRRSRAEFKQIRMEKQVQLNLHIKMLQQGHYQPTQEEQKACPLEDDQKNGEISGIGQEARQSSIREIREAIDTGTVSEEALQRYNEMKAREAEKMRAKRAAMPEERKAWLRQRNTEQSRQRKLRMTEEERTIQRERNAQMNRERRKRLTEEQRQVQREKDARAQRTRRNAMLAAMTPEERLEWKKAESERRRNLRIHRLVKLNPGLEVEYPEEEVSDGIEEQVVQSEATDPVV